MGCSFDATQIWQPVTAGLFWALGILVAGTVVLYGAALGLGALGERRATRARLARLHRVAAGAERDHRQVAARLASIPVEEDPAHRLAERLDHADDVHTTVAALMGGEEGPDLTHRGDEIDEAVARYRETVDRLTTTWSTCSAGGPGPDRSPSQRERSPAASVAT